jgi:3alpha(or 20beta)-hydroxysteroid dehydrogenase
MTGSHEDKTVIVTGASRGQGASEARAFASGGAQVILCDVLDELGEAVTAEIVADGGIARYRHLDVGDRAQWRSVVDELRADCGLHALVNNAGITNRRGRVMNSDWEDWDRVLAVNLKGCLFGIQETATLIRDSGGGAIVNIGSIAALGGHFSGAYSVSKWGIRGLTKAAAMELLTWGVRVNTVHPGIVVTPVVEGSEDFVDAMRSQTPMGRTGLGEEIAAAVMFLASDAASFITGVDLPVDGGFTDLSPYWRVAEDIKSRPASKW